MKPLKLLERLFELTLWSSRLAVLVAVVFGIVLSLGAFYLATIDAFYALQYLIRYGDPTLGTEVHEGLRADAVTAIIKAIDGYLVAAILIVFSLGLYERFLSGYQEAFQRTEGLRRRLLRREGDVDRCRHERQDYVQRQKLSQDPTPPSIGFRLRS